MIIICVILVLLLIMYIAIEMNSLQTTKYNIVSKKIPDNFDKYKILHLSDLHSKNFGKNNKRLLDKIYEINPDIVIMSGDMVSSFDKNHGSFFIFIRELTKKYKVYYTLGNHEKHLMYFDLKEFKRNLKRCNVIVLDDKIATIFRDDQSINLYGFDYKSNMDLRVSNKKTDKKGYNIIFNTFGRPNKEEYNILIAHDPSNYKIYDKWGADLTLSGHVHGGIIRFGKIGLLSPKRKFFPKYCIGKYEMNNSQMIVSRGLGNSTLKLRIFNVPEIICITLHNNV